MPLYLLVHDRLLCSSAVMDHVDVTRRPFVLERFFARPPKERHIGPFWLLEQLGHGSFAPVWLAHETYGQTPVRMAAVKLFALGSVGTKGQERIVREAHALCQVEHPNVVRFYSLPIDEDAGIGGLAMEHIAGASLGKRITAQGLLDPKEVMRIGLALAAALDAVHCAGLVHRDVKPDNVVESNGVYKLIDFGIAQGDFIVEANTDPEPNGSDELATLRPVQGPSGTRGYVDPECFQGLPANYSSDLFALGATLYACLTGHPPVVTAEHPAPELDSSVPKELRKVIAELVMPARKDRPGSAALVKERFLEMVQPNMALARRKRAKFMIGIVVTMLMIVADAFIRPLLSGVPESGRWSCLHYPAYVIVASRDDPDGQSVPITLRSVPWLPSKWGCLRSFLDPRPWRGKRVRMSAEMSTSAVSKGAQLWLRIDGPYGNVLAFDSMWRHRVTGDTEERHYEIVLDVPNDTSQILFGLILVGTGSASIRNVQFQSVGLGVPTTGFTGDQLEL